METCLKASHSITPPPAKMSLTNLVMLRELKIRVEIWLGFFSGCSVLKQHCIKALNIPFHAEREPPCSLPHCAAALHATQICSSLFALETHWQEAISNCTKHLELRLWFSEFVSHYSGWKGQLSQAGIYFFSSQCHGSSLLLSFKTLFKDALSNFYEECKGGGS